MEMFAGKRRKTSEEKGSFSDADDAVADLI